MKFTLAIGQFERRNAKEKMHGKYKVQNKVSRINGNVSVK